MNATHPTGKPAHCSDEEWALRVKLAHCYHPVSYTHLTLPTSDLV